MNAKICGNVFHKTTRAFVNVKNTATNVANKSKKFKARQMFKMADTKFLERKIERIIPKKIPNRVQST